MLEIKDLKVDYSGAYVLNGISLTVKRGEIVTLIGANGAGKSTLLKTISGLKHPSKGTIKFLDKRIDSLPPQAVTKRGVAHVLEGRRLFPLMTVMENLRLGGYTINDRESIARSIEKVFKIFPILKQRVNQAAGTLSGGEQQMVAVARAMMCEPALLLLDEPSMGLAPILVEEIFRVIEELRNREISILLVEQNAWVALEIADKGYVLENGIITHEGKGRELLENPKVINAYLGAEEN